MKPWSEFWRLTAEAAAHRGGGPQEEALGRFWASFFEGALALGAPPRVADVGCGNGAVVGELLRAAGHLGTPARSVVGIDASLQALAGLRRRYPGVSTIVADARRIPFPTGSFDVVVSQFGLEYAGADAFVEAARLVAPEGVLGAVVHLKGGPIDRECAANLAAIEQVRRAAVLPATKAYFAAARALREGGGSRAAFRVAGEALLGSLRALESVLAGAGPPPAGGSLHRLHADVSAMYRRPDAFDEREATAWAEAIAGALDAYAGRMSSMTRAAVDVSGIEVIGEKLAAAGLPVRSRGEIVMGIARPEPGAWALVCGRGQTS